MNVQVEKEQTSPVECELKVTVPAELMAERVTTALEEVARKARLPGFRPGHVPRRVVEERFGPAARQEVVDEILQEAYRAALNETGVHPLSPGEMRDVSYQKDEPLTFSVKVEVIPEFAVPPLSEITVEMAQPSIEEEDVQSALDGIRESHAVLTPTEEAATRDSVVTVDLQELDPSGLPIVGRVKRDLEIDLSRSQLGEDFAAKVIGLAAGQQAVVELPVRSAEKEAKAARFQVAVRAVRRKELPVLDDEFARAVNPQLSGLDDLTADVRRFLEARARHQAQDQMFRSVVEALLRRVEFPVPPRMLDGHLNRMIEDGSRGRKPDPKEIEQLKEEYRASAVWNLRWYLMRRKIIAERQLEVSESDYRAEIERLARLDSHSVEEFERRLTEEQADHIREDLLERKVLTVVRSEVQTVPRPMSLAEFEGRTPGRVVAL